MTAISLKRPSILAVLVSAALACTGLVVVGLGEVRAGLEAAPAVVAVDRAALPAALESAPSVESSAGEGVVWIVTKPNCPACRALEDGAVAKLLDSGAAVHVLVVAPRGESYDDATLARVAAVAVDRSWQTYQACFSATASGLVCDPPALEPAAQEGYLEWGRATLDRIESVVAANDMPMAFPIVFWQRGREWRATTGGDPRALTYLTRDFDVGS